MKQHASNPQPNLAINNAILSPAVTQNNTSSLLQTSMRLAFCKAMLVPATQPIQVIMRMQQAEIKNRNIMSIVDTVKFLRSKQNGRSVLGIPTAFFRGTTPAITKEAWKSLLYKGFLFKGSPKLAAKYFPYSLRHHNPVVQHLCIASLAAIIASASDTAIGGPLERLATYRATSQGHHKNANFIQELKKHAKATDKFKFIYQGSGASLLKTGVACFTLFAASGPIQQFINKKHRLQPGDNIPHSAAALTALLTGGAVAVASSPLDIAKTMAQAPDSKHTGSASSVIRNNFKAIGLKAITTGLPSKMLLTILGWGIVSLITQQSKTAPEEYTYRFK
jgi:hypothetical protein